MIFEKIDKITLQDFAHWSVLTIISSNAHLKLTCSAIQKYLRYSLCYWLIFYYFFHVFGQMCTLKQKLQQGYQTQTMNLGQPFLLSYVSVCEIEHPLNLTKYVQHYTSFFGEATELSYSQWQYIAQY